MAASVLQLSYCEGAVPLSVLAAASLAGVELAAKVNPKLPKGSQPVLALPNRWVFISQSIDALTQEILSNYAEDTTFARAGVEKSRAVSTFSVTLPESLLRTWDCMALMRSPRCK